MGYMTDYTLNVKYFDTQCDLEFTEIKKLIEELDPTNDIFEENTLCTFAKWYKHDEDMIEFSKKHPDLLFELEGKGEDDDDIWKAYYHNGKMQFCIGRIIYDELEIEKLK